MKNKIYGAVIISLGIVVIFYYLDHFFSLQPLLYFGYIQKGLQETDIKNLVTQIYLDYRVFDTLFETLLLLCSVIAIKEFSSLFSEEINQEKSEFTHHDEDQYTLPRYIMSIVYPLFVIFGMYVIINGVNSPGGGFQGGAIIATLLMSRSISGNVENYNQETFYIQEKYTYIFILFLVAYSLLLEIPNQYIKIYMFMMNALIGYKVYCGFSYIFLNYVKDEG